MNHKHLGSSCRLIMVLGALIVISISAQLQAATMTASDIAALKQQLEQQVRAEINQQAKHYQWPSYQAHIKVMLANAVNHLALCPQAVIVSHSDQPSLPLGRIKRRISCQTESVNWQFSSTINVSLTLPVLVAKTPIKRGRVISRDMLQQQQIRLNYPRDFTSQFSQVLGRQSQRHIRVGQLINPNLLAPDWLIKKSQTIEIVVNHGGVYAKTTGIALENGLQGELIRVENKHSKKQISAKVIGQGQVQTKI